MNKKFLSAITAMAAVATVFQSTCAINLSANADWYENGSDWYYSDESGNNVVNSWQEYDGINYFLKADGKMAADEWAYDPNTNSYYYFDENGVPVITPELFKNNNGAVTSINKDQTITQTKTIDGVEYAVIINLQKWGHGASPEQIATTFDVFWSCYPKMHKRFASDENSKKVVVTIAFDKEYDGCAYADGRFVHVSDNYIKDGTDYDCIIHELAHTLQNRIKKGANDYWNGGSWTGWNGEYCETSDFIENFADYCRYVYSYKNGLYNDTWWNPETVKGVNGDATHNSIRFLVWLDYNYSTSNNDLICKFSDICRNREFKSRNWAAAWEKIFVGTELEGKNIYEVWNMYKADTDFSEANAVTPVQGQPSELISRYNIRGRLAR